MGNLYHEIISFIKSPNGSKILTGIAITLLIVAVPLTVWFTQQQQTTQQRAAAGDCNLGGNTGGNYCERGYKTYGWNDQYGFMQVLGKDYYIGLYICDPKTDWDKAWNASGGCQNKSITPSVKKYVINVTGKCSVNCDQVTTIGVGVNAQGYLDLTNPKYTSIFPGRTNCTLWQEDVSVGGTWHSYGNRTNCAPPANTPTPTTKPTPTPTPTTPIVTPTPTKPASTPTPTPTTPISTPTPTPTTPISTPTPTVTGTPPPTPTPTPTVTGTPPPTNTPTTPPTSTPILTSAPTPNTPLVINRQQPQQQIQAPLPTSRPIPTQVPTGNTLGTIGTISIGSLLILLGGILILL